MCQEGFVLPSPHLRRMLFAMKQGKPVCPLDILMLHSYAIVLCR
jgi:hypothetical protein